MDEILKENKWEEFIGILKCIVVIHNKYFDNHPTDNECKPCGFDGCLTCSNSTSCDTCIGSID